MQRTRKVAPVLGAVRSFLRHCVCRWILEKYYDKKVVAMHIVGLHPELYPEPLVEWVPEMQREVEVMMTDQRRLASAHASAVDWRRPEHG